MVYRRSQLCCQCKNCLCLVHSLTLCRCNLQHRCVFYRILCRCPVLILPLNLELTSLLLSNAAAPCRSRSVLLPGLGARLSCRFRVFGSVSCYPQTRTSATLAFDEIVHAAAVALKPCEGRQSIVWPVGVWSDWILLGAKVGAQVNRRIVAVECIPDACDKFWC